MASSASKSKLTGLVRKLVTDGLLEEAHASEAFEHSKTKKIPFVSYIVETKWQSISRNCSVKTKRTHQQKNY